MPQTTAKNDLPTLYVVMRAHYVRDCYVKRETAQIVCNSLNLRRKLGDPEFRIEEYTPKR